MAAVRHQQDYGGALAPDGLAPSAALKLIHEKAGRLVEAQYQYWNETLRPAIAAAGVRILTREAWNAKQKKWLKKTNYYKV